MKITEILLKWECDDKHKSTTYQIKICFTLWNNNSYKQGSITDAKTLIILSLSKSPHCLTRYVI